MFAKLLFQQEKMFEERTVELYVLFVQIEYLAVMGIDIDEPVPEGSIPWPGSLGLHPFVHLPKGFMSAIYLPGTPQTTYLFPFL